MALAITICKRETKIIFSRQFVSMSKYELQEHVSNFCRKLSENKVNKILEENKFLYTYIPIEGNQLFLVLTTLQSANHFQNIKILDLIYKAMSQLCKNDGISENSIKNNSFELVYAVDEIVTQNGYIDEQNIDNLKQNLKMISYDEKDYLKVKAEKDKEIKENFDKKMLEYEQEKTKANYISPEYVSAEKLEKQKLEKEEIERVRKYRGLQLQAARNEIIQNYLMNDQRVETFIITCQALITKMIEREMTRAILNGQESDDEESGNTKKLILNPIAYMYELGSEEEDNDG